MGRGWFGESKHPFWALHYTMSELVFKSCEMLSLFSDIIIYILVIKLLNSLTNKFFATFI